MAESDRWNPEDDAVVRSALATLRRDVDDVSLADVRFVRARGETRRRRVRLSGAAAAAVVVTAVGYAGFQGLAPRHDGLSPATRTFSSAVATPGPASPTTPSPTSPSATTASATTSSPAASSTDPAVPVAAPGPLPVAVEWARAFGIGGTVRLTTLPGAPGDGNNSDCPTSAPGTSIGSVEAHAEPSGLQGGGVAYRASSTNVATVGADRVTTQLRACQVVHLRTVADSAWPKVFLGTTPAGVEWFVVAHSGRHTSLITVVGSGVQSPRWSVSQVQDLASVAQRRLVRLGSSRSPTG